jgi:hypothetical protein
MENTAFKFCRVYADLKNHRIIFVNGEGAMFPGTSLWTLEEFNDRIGVA